MGMDNFIDSLLEGEDDLSDFDDEEEQKELEEMRKKAKR